MACPHFYPVSISSCEKRPARAPLGSMYEGRCEIGGEAGGDACNFGYASGRCEVFPAGEVVDAVRFTMLDGRAVYVLEKDYSPVRFGDAESIEGGALGRQAEVFVSWMARRG